MDCLRCQKSFSKRDIAEDLLRVVPLHGTHYAVCITCEVEIIKEWVIVFLDISDLKTS